MVLFCFSEMCLKMTEEQRSKIKEKLERAAQEWRWLLSRMKPYRGGLAAVTVVGMVGTVAAMATSVVSKYLIDAVVTRNFRILWLALAAMAVMSLGGTALRLLGARLNARFHVKVRDQFQLELFQKMMRASWQELERHSSGDLLSRLNSDISVVAGGVVGMLPGLIVAMIKLVGAMAVLLCYEPVSAVIALVGTPVTLLISHALLKKLRKHDLLIKELGMGMMSFQEDSLRSLTQIKALGASKVFMDRMQTRQGEYRKAYLDYQILRSGLSLCLSGLNTAVMVLCLCWGAHLLWQGGMSYGSLVLLMQLVSMLRSAMSALSGQMQQSVSILTSVARVMTVENLPDEDHAVPAGFVPDRPWEVLLEQVECRYHTGEAILKDFDFTAKPGELVAITGTSGVGKTTLLRLLLGMLEPAAGRVLLRDDSGKAFGVTAGTRGAFSYVPQGNSIFDGTIAENLRIAAPDASDEALREALAAACAWEFVEKLPQGMHQHLHGGGKGLSEGQCQRLAIARALLRKAPILLLDEATSALDEATERKLLDSLRRSNAVRTCILVTHRPAVAQCCDRSYEISG